MVVHLVLVQPDPSLVVVVELQLVEVVPDHLMDLLVQNFKVALVERQMVDLEVQQKVAVVAVVGGMVVVVVDIIFPELPKQVAVAVDPVMHYLHTLPFQPQSRIQVQQEVLIQQEELAIQIMFLEQVLQEFLMPVLAVMEE
jgi:hypothetical protein